MLKKNINKQSLCKFKMGRGHFSDWGKNQKRKKKENSQVNKYNTTSYTNFSMSEMNYIILIT